MRREGRTVRAEGEGGPQLFGEGAGAMPMEFGMVQFPSPLYPYQQALVGASAPGQWDNIAWTRFG